MGKYKRYKNSIEKFLSGDSGKRFFNFAYSIGAAIVIWGALFKILHLPGGNVMLSIGMGVEVLMFILTAFDRPAKEYHWEEVFPVLASKDPEDRPDFKGGGGIVVNGNLGGDGNIVVSGTDARRIAGIPSNIEVSEEDTKNLSESIQKLSAAAEQISRMAELTDATQKYLDQMAAISEQMLQFRQATQSLTDVSNLLLNSYRHITDNSDGITQHTQGYVEQMESLNRNIAGLNTIYEIQLKGISSQLDNIDRVNVGLRNIRQMYEDSMQDSSRYCEEVEKMTQYMAQLNAVYRNMLTAMTINMYNPSPRQEQPQQSQQPATDNDKDTQPNA
mgnify:FL=1